MNNSVNNNGDKKPNKALALVKGFFSTIWRWTRRTFMGASRDLADVMSVERLESPAKMAVKEFFRRKLAVGALILLISMFLFVFVGPLFVPMNLNYTDANLANIAPNYSMRDVPNGLKNNVKTISGFSNFTIGVSNDNDFYIWGVTYDALSKIEISNLPEEIKEGEVYTAAAGHDHIIAITTSGKLVGWGANTLAQYGRNPAATSTELIFMDDALADIGVDSLDLSKVDQLVCGYQTTALVYDGKLYAWGNSRNCLNMVNLVSGNQDYKDGKVTVEKVVLGNYQGMVLYSDGTVYSPQVITKNTSVYNAEGNRVKFSEVDDNKIVDIAATYDSFAMLDENGAVFVSSANKNGEANIPAVGEGEKIVAINAGTRHLIATTDNGYCYGWGLNDDGQLNVGGVQCADVFTGSKQTYLVNAEDDLVKDAGLKGYLFGTDKLGRDVFTRIMHGGQMTMTVGAVAVIVSSLIAILVGCISGYFGGWVDMLLMRITEICSAIPFLPFAMMLSYVIQKNPIDENTRILIIMIMLGLLSWTGLARMIRGQVLAEREKEFVVAAKAMGIKESRITFKHILPNVISVILVSMTLDFAGCLLTESSLSYLGFGVQQPRPTWGNMLNGANNSIVIQNYWWQWVFPAIFLAMATISINIIGDTLRDVLDPKSTRDK